jgi:hypothetical protein
LIVAIETPPFGIDFASQKLFAEEIMVAILRLITGQVYGERLNRYEAV